MNMQRHIRIGAPPLSKRGRRLSRAGAVAGAVALVASPLALLALPAGAQGGSQISEVTGYTGTHVVTPGNPQAASTARLSASYVAEDPANGDLVVASAENGYIYIVTPAGTTESATDFGLGASGTLTGGDAYAVGGNGTGFAYNSGEGYNGGTIIGHPGATSGDGGSPSAVGTSNSVIANSVAFDPDGNILLAGSGLQPNDVQAAVVQVIARTSGSFYGVSMIAGDLYTIADKAVDGAPSTAITMNQPTNGGYSITTDGTEGHVFVGANYGVDLLNFGSGSLSLYGTTELADSSTTVAGNVAGSATCTSGAQSVPATSGTGVWYNDTATVVDSSGNLYLSDDEAGPNNGCVWVVPAQSGTVDGQSVTAGNAYKVAGNGGDSYTPDGTAADDANVGTTAGVALDSLGNLVLAEDGGTGTGLSPAVQVVAAQTGDFYGTWMTAGDVYTIAGGPSASSTTLPGPSAGFELNGPTSLAFDGQGDLYLTDEGSNGTDPTTGNVYEITGGPSAALTIQQQPSSQVAFTGQSVTFTAYASGIPVPTVQWQYKLPTSSNFTDVPSGGTSDSYTVSDVTETAGTQYQAIFTSGSSTATTNAATLQVYTLTWKAPKGITYGTALSSTQLDAAVTFGGHPVTTGTIAYSPNFGAVPAAGSDTLSVSYTPAGSSASATGSTTLAVAEAKPTLSWSTPSAITFGTALSGTQLDATATAVVGGSTVSVPGYFIYTPAADTVPAVGTAKLEAAFVSTSPNFLGGGVVSTSLTVSAIPSQVSLSISPSTVSVGAEQLAVLTVNVAPLSGTSIYPPVGKVTVSAGSTTLCTITLANVGSCVVSSQSLLPASGTPYQVTASYATSNKEYGPSTSSPENLTVNS